MAEAAPVDEEDPDATPRGDSSSAEPAAEPEGEDLFGAAFYDSSKGPASSEPAPVAVLETAELAQALPVAGPPLRIEFAAFRRLRY